MGDVVGPPERHASEADARPPVEAARLERAALRERALVARDRARDSRAVASLAGQRAAAARAAGARARKAAGAAPARVRHDLAVEVALAVDPLAGLHGGARRATACTVEEAERRQRAAALADRVAVLADGFAAYFERGGGRGDADRRIAFARAEREVAVVERRIAGRLRDVTAPYDLVEHLPRLPLLGGPEPTDAGASGCGDGPASAP